MPFIPNAADATTSAAASQADIDSLDFEMLIDGISGNGVLSGCAVTEQGSPDMTVAVASGVVRINETYVAVSSGNVTVTANSSGDPRFDLVVVNSSGVKSVQAGTPTTNPNFPAIPANSVAIAAIIVPDSASSITNSNIVDKRITVGGYATEYYVNAEMEYGVLGDGTTDDAAAMQAAVDATPVGGTCVFPLTKAGGSMRQSAPIELKEQRTYVFPLAGRMWTYRYASPIAGSVKLTSGFSGAAAFLIQGKEITLEALDNDGIRIIGLVVDASAASGNVHGVKVEGLCRDLNFVDCAVQNAQGTGNGFDFSQGTGDAPPRGIRMERCASYAGDNHGFRFNGVTDSTFTDILGVGNGARGIYLTNSGENSLIGCRAVFNTTDGFMMDGTVTVGQTTLVAPSTDRNGQNGILITQSGTQPIQIIAPRCRRDGSSSTSANYAGIKTLGSSGLAVVPIDIIAPHIEPGEDDGGGGNITPQWGIRAIWSQRVHVSGGDVWGVAGGFANGGNNTILTATKDTYFASGTLGAKSRETFTAVGPIALPIGEGGTGATTAPGARTNLQIVEFSATAPSSPQDTDLWWDTDNKILSIWEDAESSWIGVSNVGVYPISYLPYSYSGAVSTGTGVFRLYIEEDVTIIGARASASTAPTGSSLIVDVNLNGTTIFTTQGNRPAISAGANVSQTPDTPDVTSASQGDYITVDVDQVGSSTPGSNLTVSVLLRKTNP